MPGQIMNQADGAPRAVFTPLQGQYLAFIHAYTLVNGRPPAEQDMMRFFQVTPPTVHRMVVTLEQAGLISRSPGKPRSIVVLLPGNDLPSLEPGFGQTVKTSVTRY
jgi:DNA-binding MarR family transcriptional regulator